MIDKTLHKIFECEITSELGLINFIEQETGNDPVRLKMLKEEAEKYHQNCKGTYEIRKHLNIMKDPKPRDCIHFGEPWPEETTKKVLRIHEVFDGLAGLKRLIRIIDEKLKGYKQDNLQKDNSNFEKPHKDKVYHWYGKIREENKVKPAFNKLKKKIEEQGLNVQEYIKTDTPENFNKSYTTWKTSQNKKSISQK